MVYLLDTNACSRVIQGDSTVINRIVEVGEAQVATCVIVQAEHPYNLKIKNQVIINWKTPQIIHKFITPPPHIWESC